MLSNLLTRRRAAARRPVSTRRLRYEPLEERQLLSAVHTFSNTTATTLKDRATVSSAITVPAGYVLSTVTLNITHTRDQDLTAYLRGPDGTRITLFREVGGTGDNFTNTTLDDRGRAVLSGNGAPFTGTYRPALPLDSFRGKPTSGTWKLEVYDSTRGETGKLNSWSLGMVEASALSTSFLDKTPTILGHVDRGATFPGTQVALAENGDAMAVWRESQGAMQNGPWTTMAVRFDAATGTWGVPAVLNSAGAPGNSSHVDVATDSRGNYLAVWTQSYANAPHTLWCSRYVAGSGWQGPQLLDTGWLMGKPSVDMAYDPAAGATKAVVAYSAMPASGAADDAKVNRLFDFAANTWSGPSPAEGLPTDIYAGTVHVAMEADGDFLLVFADSTLSPSPLHSDVYYRRFDWDAGWTAPESTMESRPENVFGLSLAMNARGKAIVAWQQRTGAGGVGQEWTRRWDGSAWAGDAELVSDDPANNVSVGTSAAFNAAISDNGEAAVLYMQKRGGTPYYDAYVRRHDGQAWQEIVKVDSEDLGDVGGTIPPWGETPGVRIAMDDAGNIAAAWTQVDGEYSNLWMATFDRSAVVTGPESLAWSPAAKVENSPFSVSYPALAVNRSGAVIAAWIQPDATQYHVYAHRTTLGSAGPTAFATATERDSNADLLLLLSADRLSRSRESSLQPQKAATLADLALLDLAGA